MAMQDRAKANHDFGKDAMINHILTKGSMVANPFFLATPSVRNHGILERSMLPLTACSRPENQQNSFSGDILII